MVVFFLIVLDTSYKQVLVQILVMIGGGGEQKKSFHSLPPLCPVANSKPSLEMENEEKIRLEARRRLEEQLKQYRVQRHKERVSPLPLLDSAKIKNQLKQRACAFLYQ